ncbi:MAG TPA: hypothetical protein VF945_15795, partial [Polyangia bacterium]
GDEEASPAAARAAELKHLLITAPLHEDDTAITDNACVFFKLHVHTRSCFCLAHARAPQIRSLTLFPLDLVLSSAAPASSSSSAPSPAAEPERTVKEGRIVDPFAGLK